MSKLRQKELGFEPWAVSSKACTVSHSAHGCPRPCEIWTCPRYVIATASSPVPVCCAGAPPTVPYLHASGSLPLPGISSPLRPHAQLWPTLPCPDHLPSPPCGLSASSHRPLQAHSSEPWLRTKFSLNWPQQPAGWLWAPPLPLYALGSIPLCCALSGRY